MDVPKQLDRSKINLVIILLEKQGVMPKRAGRPPKAASQKRNAIFRFMATAAESKRLRAKAKELGLSISDYIRGAVIPKE